VIDGQSKIQLQVGGTINPRRHIYIERPEDDELLRFLQAREYCNVFSSRQMGKSSLLLRAASRLSEKGIKFSFIDVSGYLRGSENSERWYIGLLDGISRGLELPIEIESWWRTRSAETINQKLRRFFGEEIAERLGVPVVLFLDEIDATFQLHFTDDFFKAIRDMYNDRSVLPIYKQITFCLSGVANPNDLIKDQKTTPYNIARTIELHDFDEFRDDLSLLCGYLSEDKEKGENILRRVLYWTGGHPYLTMRQCYELSEIGLTKAIDVDAYFLKDITDSEKTTNDVHYTQIERILDERTTINLYKRILQGFPEQDRASPVHAQLILSGLVKRDAEGFLVVRNRIYDHLFNMDWVRAKKN